jgi:folate-binding protein YgfZ
MGNSRDARALGLQPAPRLVGVIATDEYELLTRSVGSVDRSRRGKLLVRGSEAGEFLQGQVTNDVEALEPGQGVYAALLNHKGKLRADMRILRGEGWFWIDTDPDGLAPVRHTCDVYSLGRDVSHEDVTEARSIVSLIGPQAREVLGVEVPEQEHAFVAGEHGLYVATDLGVDVIGEPGLVEALGVEAVSEAAAECLRVESGRPRLGLDMGGDTIPQEAGLNERAVNFEKGCYVGQETVARLHWRGKPNRHLRGLRLSEPAEHGEKLTLGEREVGTVGTACESPVLGPVALAIVRREAAPGDTVAVGPDGITAEVVELPFSRS